MDHLMAAEWDWSMGGGLVWLAGWILVVVAFTFLALLQGPRDE